MESAAKRRVGSTKTFCSKETELREWFENIVGMPEDEFGALSNTERQKFFREDAQGYLRLKKGKGRESQWDVQCGKFSLEALEKLENEAGGA